jgi:hypothetical protein
MPSSSASEIFPKRVPVRISLSAGTSLEQPVKKSEQKTKSRSIIALIFECLLKASFPVTKNTADLSVFVIGLYSSMLLTFLHILISSI